MLSGILIGTLLGVGFFTYKPLFDTLKRNKFSLSAAYKDYKENEETKEAFKSFAHIQMNKIKKLIGKVNQATQNKFGSNEKASKEAENKTSKSDIQPTNQKDDTK